MIDPRDAGYDAFLHRKLGDNIELPQQNLKDSSIGSRRTLTPAELGDLIPLGSIFADRIAAGTIEGNLIKALDILTKTISADTGTIGGWTISSTALTSSNITIDSANKRILISDGTNNRVLLGYQLNKF